PLQRRGSRAVLHALTHRVCSSLSHWGPLGEGGVRGFGLPISPYGSSLTPTLSPRGPTGRGRRKRVAGRRCVCNQFGVSVGPTIASLPLTAASSRWRAAAR